MRGRDSTNVGYDFLFLYKRGDTKMWWFRQCASIQHMKHRTRFCPNFIMFMKCFDQNNWFKAFSA